MMIVNAFIGDGNYTNVKLSVDISRSGDNTVTDINKLEKTLQRERTRNSNVVGIYDWEEGILVFTNDNKFSGRIWATKTPLSGHWTIY